MATNIELYEALKPSVGEDAARMIADVVPPSRDLATHMDVHATRMEIERLRFETRAEIEHLRNELHAEIGQLRREMAVGFEELKGAINAAQVSTMRWMLTLFVPLWLAMLAAVTTFVLRGT